VLVHRARKSLGQNFLTDPNQQKRIVDAIGATPDSDVLEIGPGLGALTHRLAGSVRHLTAVELDRDLASQLRTRYEARDDIDIIEADFLDLNLPEITADPASLLVVGNIPYNITSPIIFHLLERANRPRRITLMVQREVADRIAATPGSDAYGALSVGVQAVATIERLFLVGRNAFRPVPRVDSAVIQITPTRPFPLNAEQEADLRELTRTTFSWRRKQLQRTLRSAPRYHLSPPDIHELQQAAGIPLQQRPETLAASDFIRLAAALRAIGRPADP
jgi:16S rRNA (adenine1518-N6/adenine1519-N6)-dimethyltransferase